MYKRLHSTYHWPDFRVLGHVGQLHRVFLQSSSSDRSENTGDFAAGIRSGLNASPASRSIGIPEARANLSASMSRSTRHSSIQI